MALTHAGDLSLWAAASLAGRRGERTVRIYNQGIRTVYGMFLDSTRRSWGPSTGCKLGVEDRCCSKGLVFYSEKGAARCKSELNKNQSPLCRRNCRYSPEISCEPGSFDLCILCDDLAHPIILSNSSIGVPPPVFDGIWTDVC